jgi:hypothetical protein
MPDRSARRENTGHWQKAPCLLSHFGRVKTPAFQAAASAFIFLYLRQLRCLWQYVVSTAFIRDFLIGEADITSFSYYSKPPASAGGAFTHFPRLGKKTRFQPAVGYGFAFEHMNPLH